MVDILTHVFSTYIAKGGQVTSGGLWSTCSALVVGDHSLSRSVLLLAALSAASRAGMKVLYFTPTPIQSLPPSVQSCLPSLSPESLKMIKFCYPRTLEELLQQVASLHEPANTSPTAPSLLIVDRLHSFLCSPGGGGGGGVGGFHQGLQSCAAHLSALLHDTAAFLTQVLERQAAGLAPCRVLASFQPETEAPGAPADSGALDPVLAVLDRYFPARCTLERDKGYAAAAAGLEDVWQVYLSGAGATDGTTTHHSDRTLHEWQLSVSTNGLMEFRPV
ncbi:hypothetical protein CRUP_011345 [Coryphaenoides rupestris]|nr:hypothetical protein CRUP_011345 [Coryphaenoides rupestris]